MGHVLGRSARPCCPPAGGVGGEPDGLSPSASAFAASYSSSSRSCIARSCWGVRHLSDSVRTPDPRPAPRHTLSPPGACVLAAAHHTHAPRPPITHMHPGILLFSVGLAELYPLGEDPTEGKTLASWRGTWQRRVEGAPWGRRGRRSEEERSGCLAVALRQVGGIPTSRPQTLLGTPCLPRSGFGCPALHGFSLSLGIFPTGIR